MLEIVARTQISQVSLRTTDYGLQTTWRSDNDMSTTTNHGHGPAGPTAEELARSVAVGHEISDTGTGPMVYGTFIVALLLILAFAGMAGLLFVVGQGANDASHVLEEDPARQLPPAPRLEQNPRVDGDRIITEATERLESYGWVNQRAGTAHIPIERAMELIVEQGVNPFAAPAEGGATP